MCTLHSKWCWTWWLLLNNYLVKSSHACHIVMKVLYFLCRLSAKAATTWAILITDFYVEMNFIPSCFCDSIMQYCCVFSCYQNDNVLIFLAFTVFVLWFKLYWGCTEVMPCLHEENQYCFVFFTHKQSHSLEQLPRCTKNRKGFFFGGGSPPLHAKNPLKQWNKVAILLARKEWIQANKALCSGSPHPRTLLQWLHFSFMWNFPRSSLFFSQSGAEFWWRDSAFTQWKA